MSAHDPSAQSGGGNDPQGQAPSHGQVYEQGHQSEPTQVHDAATTSTLPPSYPPSAPTTSGHTYTEVPPTPAGYDFSRASSRPAPVSAAAPSSGQEAAYSAFSASAPGAGQPYPGAPQSYAQAAGYGGGAKRDKRRGPGWLALVLSTVLAALLGTGGAVAAIKATDGQTSAGQDPTAQSTALATGDTTRTVNSQGQTPNWEEVTNAVGNSVVAITVSNGEKQGVGSGVIYDNKGHILTNDHVVGGASEMYVSLADGRLFEAKLTGTDPATDLAVIELVDAPDNLTVAQMGDSSSLVTGQDVMAIGNPLGLSSTVTTGIISSLDRPVVNKNDQESGTDAVYTNAIQIDAAVNPGNSGGPLFDEKGHVIGITSSIASTSEDAGSIGIGFAIPVNLATKIAKQLIDKGSATHAYLGVGLDNGLGEAEGETRSGAKVTSVESGSPADKAGLKKDDIIVAIDGKTTAQAAALTGFVRQYSAGDTVTLTVFRGKEKLEVETTLVERPDPNS